MLKHKQTRVSRAKKPTSLTQKHHLSKSLKSSRKTSTLAKSHAIRRTLPLQSPQFDTKKKVLSATVKGTKDYFPNSTFLYRHIQKQFESTLATYGYNNEIRTPILETAEVFGTTLGADSDVVMKQMYQFDDFGVQTVLRPENTASVVRAVVKRGVNISGDQSNLDDQSQSKDDDERSTRGIAYPDQFFYCGPMFRRERPQNGRLRQFTQFGVENIGSLHPYEDIQVVALAYDCLRSLGLEDHIVLAINSIGSLEERQNYETSLGSYLKPYAHMLSTDSRKRYQNGTFLRILDSSDELDLAIVRAGSYITSNPEIVTRLKQRHVNYVNGTDTGDQLEKPTNPLIQPADLPAQAELPQVGAPLLRHHLSDESLDRFNTVLKGLNELNIPYQVDDFLIRGLGYYSHTTFEFLVDQTTAEPIAQQFDQWHVHQEAIYSNKPIKFNQITKSTPLMTLPQSSYQAILAGGRYGDIATRFDKYKAGSAALQPLNIGMGWASGLERVILHMDRLGLVTEDMIAAANKLVDVVVVAMGTKRQLTKAGHKAFLHGFEQEAAAQVAAEAEEGDPAPEDPCYNGPLDNVSWSFDSNKVTVMQDQVYTHHLMDQHKAAKKEASNKEAETGTTGLVDALEPPPKLPYTPQQVESIVTDSALVLATKLRRNGQRVLYQPHLTFQKQMASTHGAKFALIVGENEVAHNAVQVKNLKNHKQDLVNMSDIIEFLVLDSVSEQQQLEMGIMDDHGIRTQEQLG